MNDDVSALERFRIHELIHKYVDALNHRDWTRFAECWCENGVLQLTSEDDSSAPRDRLVEIERPNNFKRDGRGAILDLVEGYERFLWLFQMPHALVVEMIDLRSARVRHTLHVYSQSMIMMGICYDRVAKEDDGVWRIAHRDFRPSYYENFQAPGLTTRMLPNVDYDYRLLPS